MRTILTVITIALAAPLAGQQPSCSSPYPWATITSRGLATPLQWTIQICTQPGPDNIGVVIYFRNVGARSVTFEFNAYARPHTVCNDRAPLNSTTGWMFSNLPSDTLYPHEDQLDEAGPPTFGGRSESQHNRSHGVTTTSSYFHGAVYLCLTHLAYADQARGAEYRGVAFDASRLPE